MENIEISNLVYLGGNYYSSKVGVPFCTQYGKLKKVSLRIANKVEVFQIRINDKCYQITIPKLIWYLNNIDKYTSIFDVCNEKIYFKDGNLLNLDILNLTNIQQMIVGFHKCSKCFELKPLSKFRKDSSKKQGVYSVCRKCSCKVEPIYKFKSNKKGEIWKDIPNSNYQCSNTQKVYSKSLDRIISSHKKSNGYMSLSIDGEEKYLHRIMAICFIPNPENKKFINHINGIRHDCRIENLEWCTSSENALHAWKFLPRKNKSNKQLTPCK